MFRKNVFFNSIFLITSLFTFLFLHFIEFSRHALASKETDRQSFIEGCRKGVKSDRFYPTVKKNLESYGWPNESVELHFNYQTEVIKHPLVFERYCQDLLTIAMSNDNLVQQINKEARENNGVSITSIRIGYQMITNIFLVV